MQILVFDTETSLHNKGETKVGSFTADPWHPENWIVWLGMRFLRDDLSTRKATQTFRFQTRELVAIPAPRVADGLLLVGHNIKFDLEYLAGPGHQYNREWRALINNPKVLLWDTMQAEFRMRGQSVINPSLDYCCEQRNLPLKDNRMKEYWNAGVSTEDIPDCEVEPYLIGDVDNTTEVFRSQVAWAVEHGVMPLMRMEMDAIAATCVMEINGMAFDKQGAMEALESELQPELDALYSEVAGAFAERLEVPVEAINPNSNPFLNAFLYGGEWSYRLQELMYTPEGEAVLFKSGKKKGEHKKRWNDYEKVLPRLVPAKCKLTGVDEETLGKLKPSLDEDTSSLLDKLLKLREVSKEAKTYYRGYSSLTWPDGLIHGNLNHSITATARLSSSSPNLQNAAHGRIRKYFGSRYEGGHLLEVDLSQIEVVVQAFLSQDAQLIADIEAGTDFHSKRAAAAAGVEYETVLAAYKAEDPYWTAKRKGAKQFSFQRAYGAGAPTISASTGMSIKDVEQLILAEETMYPGVVQYQNDCIKAVTQSTAMRDGVTCGSLSTATGSEYRFQREQRKGEWTYKPTTIKNYPVQGFAGDIIKLILGGIRKFLWNYNRQYRESLTHGEVLVIMTVHDSVIFDVPAWVALKELTKLLIALFISVRSMLLKRFGIDFNVPVKADAEAGRNWYKYHAEKNPHGMRGVH